MLEEFMIEEKLKLSDGFLLSITIFLVHRPKGIVQIVHGAKEHRKRYFDFAKFLQRHGYIVEISDHRGHGESVNEDYPLGYFDDYERIVEDEHEITEYLKKRYQGLPVYLFGHSLGSMFARVYLERYDNQIDKLILSGVANYVPGVFIGVFFGKLFLTFRKKTSYSKLLERFANFLDDSWVVGNIEALELYRQDVFCSYRYPIISMLNIFLINQELHHVSNYICRHPKLPILMVSGELDPVTGGEKGLKDTISTLQKIGYTHIENKVYASMYHEVLNEKKHQVVYEDILLFLEK